MLEESTTGNNMSRKATLLIGEILQLANRVLPLSVAAKIQVPSYPWYTSRLVPNIIYRRYQKFSIWPRTIMTANTG